MLAMHSVTFSLVAVGKYVSRSFKEQRGTREGSVEAPHHFNTFIASLREELEAQRTGLCKLLTFTISVLLYADDAAILADSAEDLVISARILEEFCNSHH
eukprot:9727813-Karenia_brevis.AAC.1